MVSSIVECDGGVGRLPAASHAQLESVQSVWVKNLVSVYT